MSPTVIRIRKMSVCDKHYEHGEDMETENCEGS